MIILKNKIVCVMVMLILFSLLPFVSFEADDLRLNNIPGKTFEIKAEEPSFSQEPSDLESITRGTVKGDDRGGSWSDGFKDGQSLQFIDNAVSIVDGKAVFSPQYSTFKLSSTSDFDAGTKVDVFTNTDKSTIFPNEFRIAPKVIYSESFEALDETPLSDYSTEWSNNDPESGTARIDTNESAGGSSSLRMKTKKCDPDPYYLGASLEINHSGFEIFVKTRVLNGTNFFSYVNSLGDLDSSLKYVIRYFGGSSGTIRYFNKEKLIEKGVFDQETWYKLTLDYNFVTKTYNGWIDGGKYSNENFVQNALFYDQQGEFWAGLLGLASGTAWTGMTTITWFDELKVYGYPSEASWESELITLPDRTRLMESNLRHYGLSEHSRISKVQWISQGEVKAEYDTDITGGLTTVILEDDLTSGSFKNIKSDFKIKVYLESNGVQSPAVTEISGVFESSEGNIISEPIKLDPETSWDTLMVQSTIPGEGNLSVTVLDPNNNTIIGAADYVGTGEYDISFIDPSSYPAIKLKAVFTGSSFVVPALDFWGVSWVAKNTWRDTYFGGLKIDKIENVDLIDGDAFLKDSASITSSPINVPFYYMYDSLKIKMAIPFGSTLNFSIIDIDGNSIPGFENLNGINFDLFLIDPQKFPSIRIKADFNSPDGKTGKLYHWSVQWSGYIPMDIELSVGRIDIYRTNTETIQMDMLENDKAEGDLTISVKYKTPSSTDWEQDYFGEPVFKNNQWEIDFNPPADAVIGMYIVNVTISDAFEVVYYEFEIHVMNNLPSAPDVSITPVDPGTDDVLTVFAGNSTDIETNSEDIVYWYRWYNGVNHLDKFDNATTLPGHETSPNEYWRCVVFAFDGNDTGPSSEAVVWIYDPAVADTDGDGVTDDKDAFPDDPAASRDYDGDGLPDVWNPGKSKEDSTTKLDIDPTPYGDATSDEGRSILGINSSNLTIIVLILIMILLLVVVKTIMISRSKRQRLRGVDMITSKTGVTEIKDHEKFLKDLEFDISRGKSTRYRDLTSQESLGLLMKRRESGAISDETFDYIHTMVQDNEEFHYRQNFRKNLKSEGQKKPGVKK